MKDQEYDIYMCGYDENECGDSQKDRPARQEKEGERDREKVAHGYNRLMKMKLDAGIAGDIFIPSPRRAIPEEGV